VFLASSAVALARKTIAMENVYESKSSETGAAMNSGANDNNDQVLLNELLPLWQDHQNRGLDLRHRTGARINAVYGPPTERQAYRGATLQRHSEMLGVSESDISRMRWFAHHFSSVEDLKTKHPTATSWTKVKTLIAQLSASTELVAKAPSDYKKLEAERPIRQAIKAAHALQQHVHKLGKLQLGSDDWTVMCEAVDAMLKAVENSLGLHFQIVSTGMPGQFSPAATMYREAVRLKVEVEKPDPVKRKIGVRVDKVNAQNPSL